MIKTLSNLFKQDKEKFVVPKGVQDCIPIYAIYDDGFFRVGRDKYSKTFKFTDINYDVASREDKEAMFLEYSELLTLWIAVLQQNSLSTTDGSTVWILKKLYLFPKPEISWICIEKNTTKYFLIRLPVPMPPFRINMSLSLSIKRVWRMQEHILLVWVLT